MKITQKRGYTLIEILVVLGLIGILSGIATISYSGIKVGIIKKDLKLSAGLFASSVSSCIRGVGGWSVKNPDTSTLNVNPDPHNTNNVLPCFADTANTTKNELKEYLNYDCPKDAEECVTYQNSTPNANEENKCYCLSIQQEVSGKKLQIIVQVPYNKPHSYRIWCNKNDEDLSAYKDLKNDSTCKCGIANTQLAPELEVPCKWK